MNIQIRSSNIWDFKALYSNDESTYKGEFKENNINGFEFYELVNNQK